jgi:hypothetical protein
MPSIEQQIEELMRLLEAKAGPLASLYERVFDGYRVYHLILLDEEEDDEGEPVFRLLAPPVTEAEVAKAEEGLGFALPPLLRAVYTRIGNGGYCLSLVGLDGGQGGFDDLGFQG